MQVREQGKQILLVRTHYDAAKKRTEGKVFAKFERYVSTIPDSIRPLLNLEPINEIEQLERFFIDRKEKDAYDLDCMYLRTIDQYIKRTIKALASEKVAPLLGKRKAGELYESIELLKKALKKAGYEKPVKQVVVNINQTDLEDVAGKVK